MSLAHAHQPFRAETLATAAGVGPGPLLVTKLRAAELAGLCERSIEGYIAKGDLPVVRFGRAVRIDLADLRAFIEARKVKAAKP